MNKRFLHIVLILTFCVLTYAGFPSNEELVQVQQAYNRWAAENEKLTVLESEAEDIESKITLLKSQLYGSPPASDSGNDSGPGRRIAGMQFIRERQLEALLRRSHEVLEQLQQQRERTYPLLEDYRLGAVAYNIQVLEQYLPVSEQPRESAAECMNKMVKDNLYTEPMGIWLSDGSPHLADGRPNTERIAEQLTVIRSRRRYVQQVIHLLGRRYELTRGFDRITIAREQARYYRVDEVLALYETQLLREMK